MKKSDIQNLIKELIEKTTVGLTEITVGEDNTKTTWFKVEVTQPNFFLDHEGEALFALNHVVRRIVESKIPKSEPSLNLEDREELNFLIDVNGFQKKRVDGIHAVAHMMAERARYFKSNIDIDPMPAFDRRIVHQFLSDAKDLKTESAGIGPTRHIVIKYLG